MEEKDFKKISNKISKMEKQIEQNNDILKGIRSHNRWAMFFRFLYWILLLGAAYGIWIFLQPVWETFKEGLNQVSETGNNLKNSVDSVKDALGSVLGN
ncbi:hypothetical protein CSB11_03015 [Candidatus Campbellbacteria bacterium]|nr:MAG: hypothetical protein CSB11_03015 [Candidatus Campbellbacteria bacterium]